VRHQRRLQCLRDVIPVVFAPRRERVADDRAASHIKQHQYPDPVHDQQSLETKWIVDTQRQPNVKLVSVEFHNLIRDGFTPSVKR
jgi:hypothetical protein